MAPFGGGVIDLTSDDDYVMIDEIDLSFQPSSTPSRFNTGKHSVSARSPFASPSRSPFAKLKSFFSGSQSRRMFSLSSTTPKSSPQQTGKSVPELFQSSWNFPADFSRSYSPIPKAESSSHSSTSKRRKSSASHNESESPLKQRTSIVNISSDSEDDLVFVSRRQPFPSVELQPSRSGSRRSSTASRDVIADYDPFEIIEIDLDEEEGWIYKEEDIFAERTPTSWEISKPTPKPSKKTIRLRNTLIELPNISIPRKKCNGGELRASHCVELLDGDFLYIKTIIEDCSSGGVTLRGWRLRRLHKMEGVLHHKLNEVCWLFDVDLDDPRLVTEQSVDEVPFEEVAVQRELRVTNQQFPACRFDPQLYVKHGKDWVYNRSELVVRWKYITTFANARDRVDGKFSDRRLEFLREKDCTEDLAICDELRRCGFNENMVSGGSSKAAKKHIEALRQHVVKFDKDGRSSIRGAYRSSSYSRSADVYSIEDDMRAISLTDRHSSLRGIGSGSLTSQRRTINLVSIDDDSFELGGTLRGSYATSTRRYERAIGQKYTYGDLFSGAGGASHGAKLAGLDLRFALDHWEIANGTYEKNFPDVNLFKMSCDKFIMEMEKRFSPEMYVDILHLSPPCQYWSPAHTRPGRDDERNMASLFSVLGLVMIVKPRIATLEQTFGLHTPHFRPYFNAVVNMFTSMGYSIRWAIVQLADWGLPQSRKRLIMVASAPGEILPTFPPPTHNKDGSNGLKKWVTINEALRRIPANASDHDVRGARFAPDRFLPPYDGDQLAKTITCGGGQNNYHPSGTRGFTKRELACLQTFPLNHEFIGPYVKKQIGNAVPPKAVAKVLFSHLRRHLEKFDGVVQEAYAIGD